MEYSYERTRVQKPDALSEPKLLLEVITGDGRITYDKVLRLSLWLEPELVNSGEWCGYAFNHWSNGTYGAKVKKALDLHHNGIEIIIIGENYFLEVNK